MKEAKTEPMNGAKTTTNDAAAGRVLIWLARRRTSLLAVYATLVAFDPAETLAELRAALLGHRTAWRSGRANRGISWGHAIVLALGIIVVLLGLYILISAYYPVVPGIATLIIGAFLVVLGLAETLVEAESDRRKK